MKEDAHALIRGREKEVLFALGVSWPPTKGKRITCPLPDHDDADPSWRWNDAKRGWVCSCVNDGKYKSVFDLVMRMQGLDFGGAVRWVKEEVLGYKRSGSVRFTMPSAADLKRRQEEADREAEAEAARRRAIGLDELTRTMRRATECKTHRYLTAKRIQPHGVLQDGGVYLIITMQDSAGEVRNVQRVYIEEVEPGPKYTFSKKFIFGLETDGLFHLLGTVSPGVLLIFVEGFATGASVHEATGLPVVVCFTADNLEPVAREFRSTFPAIPFLFAADDDVDLETNKGIQKAKDAARAVGNAEIISPDFGAERGEKDTDFNDLAARCGLEEVRRQLIGGGK